MTQAVGLVYALVAAIAFGIQYVPAPLQSCQKLGGGFKYFLCSPLPGEMIQFH